MNCFSLIMLVIFLAETPVYPSRPQQIISARKKVAAPLDLNIHACLFEFIFGDITSENEAWMFLIPGALE